MHAGRCRFFASAAVGREKVNWTRRYSVYILLSELVFTGRRRRRRQFYVVPRERDRPRNRREQKRNPGIPHRRTTVRRTKRRSECIPRCNSSPYAFGIRVDIQMTARSSDRRNESHEY